MDENLEECCDTKRREVEDDTNYYNMPNKVFLVDKGDQLLSDSSQMLNINDIPQCLLLKIFSNIPFEERMQHVLLVCKYWNRLVMDYSLFKDITIAYGRNPSFVMRSLLKYNESIRSISINVWKKNDLHKAIFYSAKCKNLTRLNVSPFYIPRYRDIVPATKKDYYDDRTFEVPIFDIINAVKICKKLEELNLKYVRISCHIGQVLQEMSTHGICLKKLSIKQYMDKCCPVPMEISPFTKLEELRIDIADMALDYTTIESLLKAVSDNLKVLKLYSRNYAVSNVMTDDLLAAISGCSKIEQLTFKYPRWSFCKNITDSGFKQLFRLTCMKSFVFHCVDRISYQAFLEYFSQPYIRHFNKIEVQHCSYFNENMVNFITEKYPHLTYKGNGTFRR